jgi:hypothetical protein
MPSLSPLESPSRDWLRRAQQGLGLRPEGRGSFTEAGEGLRHDFAQPLQGGPGLVGMPKPVMGHRQERQVRRLLTLVELVGLLERPQRLGIPAQAVLGDAPRGKVVGGPGGQPGRAGSGLLYRWNCFP